MNQPVWKTVGQLGDADIVGYGGEIVVVDSREFTKPDPERYIYHWIQKGTSKYDGAGTSYDHDPRYPPEMWVIQEPVELAAGNICSVDDLPETAHWTRSTVILEQMKWVSDDEGNAYLVSVRYKDDWAHPVSAYPEWWMSGIKHVAESLGESVDNLLTRACSDDPMTLAGFYKELVMHHGIHEFDQYPTQLDRAGVERFVREWGLKS